MPTSPFRADHVSSLLRPRAVSEGRANEVLVTELCAIEDAGICWSEVETNADVRRPLWHFDFMGMLGGMDMKLAMLEHFSLAKGNTTVCRQPLFQARLACISVPILQMFFISHIKTAKGCLITH